MEVCNHCLACYLSNHHRNLFFLRKILGANKSSSIKNISYHINCSTFNDFYFYAPNAKVI